METRNQPKKKGLMEKFLDDLLIDDLLKPLVPDWMGLDEKSRKFRNTVIELHMIVERAMDLLILAHLFGTTEGCHRLMIVVIY